MLTPSSNGQRPAPHRGPREALPGQGRASSSAPSGRCTRSTASASASTGRDARPGGGVGLRQVDDRAPILRLLEPTSGTILFDGHGHHAASTAQQMRPVRRDMQIVFQDPYASLNPRMTVRDIVAEPLDIHGSAARGERERRVAELLRSWSGSPPEHANRYPARVLRRPAPAHRRSRGRSRSNPRLVVLDEPVSALDVSIQAQVVNLLERAAGRVRAHVPVHRARPLRRPAHLRPRRGDVPRQDRRDRRRATTIYDAPSIRTRRRCCRRCPYPSPRASEAAASGSCSRATCPSPANPPTGCRFRTRCWKAQDICAEEEPALMTAGQGHPVACHFAEVLQPSRSRRAGTLASPRTRRGGRPKSSMPRRCRRRSSQLREGNS